jgi:hypothetical protein
VALDNRGLLRQSWQINTADIPAGTSASPPREVAEIDRAEAMRLLASVSYGRVVFTRDALPAIRPVNHLIDDGKVILRTRLSAAISTTLRSTPTPSMVVAYEADELDPQHQTGWSVVATGVATTLTDPEKIARYERLLHPWVNAVDTVIAIDPQIVTGIRIRPAAHD